MTRMFDILRAAVERHGELPATAPNTLPPTPLPQPPAPAPLATVLLRGQPVRIYARCLAGRCANGAERDGGRLWHALPAEEWQALCGAQPGRRSAGWGSWVRLPGEGLAVTCPRCRQRLARLQAKTGEQ